MNGARSGGYCFHTTAWSAAGRRHRSGRSRAGGAFAAQRRRRAKSTDVQQSRQALEADVANAPERAALQDLYVALRGSVWARPSSHLEGQAAGKPDVLQRMLQGSLRASRAGQRSSARCSSAVIRGSTGLAESMAPSEFRALLPRFYAVASDVLVHHEGIVDKFVGDEVVGISSPCSPPAASTHAARLTRGSTFCGLPATGTTRRGFQSAWA